MTDITHPDTHPDTHPATRPAPALDSSETWTVGRVTITKFVEMAVAIPGELLLPGATTAAIQAHRDQLGPYATDQGFLTFGVHGFVLDDGERRVLVDGGIGNGKTRAEPWFDHLDTPALAQMASAGYPPESIDVVIATHLHVDHVGWLTTAVPELDAASWPPTFPNARHLVVAEEFAHWIDGPRPPERSHLGDSVDPVVAAGLVDLVAPDHEVTAEIRLVSTPGHSPGHVSVAIDSGGQRALITGDFLHHPIQVLEPGWDGPFDEDVVQSAATRRTVLGRLADTDTLVLGTHVPTPTAGRIVRTDAGWRWQAVRS